MHPDNPFPDDSQHPIPADWPSNYFNYFTEIEEHFQQARGTALFLLSPLDWALIESWKNAGVPLEAVLRGIDAAFEKWRGGKRKLQQVNSLAYCSQAVLKEAQQLLDRQSGIVSPEPKPTRVPFTREALASYLEENAAALAASPHESIRALAGVLRALAAGALAAPPDLAGLDTEDLERSLTALEEKLLAQLRLAQSDEGLLAARRELDAQLKPYRSKMSASQLRQLEEQYLSRKLLDQAKLPRLSLFYMTDYGQ
ncbi:MAG: hypothetical protein U5J83_06195 [Bryobacterales bacterium]|nr:hypothetical protein [Bryobacterales bacterium]